ncbi:MAG: VWA domain-containing protein [Verrucomicrobiae bacterium]|nr:VWA domain-containing protein [Verrucomicrobiae bacterium]
MNLTFANLAGFWALLGIPAILAIHFLQRQSQVVTISTLFLLDQMRRESVSGRRFERLRSSIPLWLQLLAVLLLTWMLVQPRWMRPDSVQRIAIVLDSSASMSAFRENLANSLKKELEQLSGTAVRTEYVAIDSQVTGQPIYSGTEIPELLASLAAWSPAGGDHDFGPALRVGRSLVGGSGLLILASDHLHEDLAYNARLLAVGEPKDNVGFAGLEISESEEGETIWEAIVRNYSETPQTRTWLLQTGKQRTPDRSLTLEPGEVRALKGRFPDEAESIVLRLEPDEFGFDDNLPAIRPLPKPVAIIKISPPELDDTFSQILGSFDGLVEPSETNPPDLAMVAYDPLNPQPLPEVAIAMIHHRGVAKSYLSGRIAAANHPLVEGLNWQSLIARQTPGIPPQPDDTVLVWQGDRHLVFLRTTEGERQLCFNFDLATSNAPRLPAFIVLLHRFVEDIREQKVATESENFEIRQPLHLSPSRAPESDPNLTWSTTTVSLAQSVTRTETIPRNRADLIRAPDEAGFFEVRQGESDESPGLLLRGAAHFADTREADLSQAASRSDLAGIEQSLIEQHSEQDANWPLWLLLLLAVLLASWYFINRPSPSERFNPVNSPT